MTFIFWTLFLLSILLLLQKNHAFSTKQNRLGQIAPINNPSIQLIHSSPHSSFIKRSSLQHHSHLQHDDNFVLQFEVYDQSFILQLTPNADLFHPVATETILHPDGTETIQAITPEQFRIFKGHVIPFDQPIDKIHSPNIDHWARITIRHDIQHDYPYPLFEGAFSYQGDIYHIKTNNNYHLYKRNDDPYLPEHWPMVIYRDSDIHDDDSPSSSSLSPIMLSSNIPFDNYLSQTSSSLSSRKLHGNHSRHGNWSSYFYNDVMCAMEELTYNRKLSGAQPFRSPNNGDTSGQSNDSNNDSGNGDNDDSDNDDSDNDDSGNDDSDNDDDSNDTDNGDTNTGDDVNDNNDGSPPTQTGSIPPDVLWNKRKRNLIVSNLEKRDAPISQGCPNSRKIAFMGAAADCSYVKSYGGIRLAKIQMVTDWNVASAVYERTFNVSLGLIYMQMSTSQCPQQPSQQMNWNQDCSNYYTINNRLSDFSFWRGQRGDDQASLWHLMTKCATGVKVGIAWLSQLCEYQASQQIEDNGLYDWVSGTGVSSITREEWKVVAHEIGHGFGAIHDCAAQSCSCQNGCACCPLSPTKCSAGETYLMNPTSNVSTNDFSPCSITDICSSFPNIGYCLKSPGDINNSTFSMCGNGILEPGEQCDPGRTDSPCCFAKNCTLKAGAICDDYSSQCCLNCAIAPKDTVCRPAASECDTEEVCTGLTSQCPPDVYDADGTSCSNGTMQCASGVCTSRDEQCTARGLRLNITQQCPFQEDSCSISCADPLDSQNCLVLSGMFLDGTECGLAGFCRSGKCVGSGFSNTVRAWVEKNKNIAIPVFIFGGLFLLGLIALIGWYIRRRYRQHLFSGGKDKNSRPSSIASSRLDNHYDGGGGGGGGGGGRMRGMGGNDVDYLNNRNLSTTTTNDEGPQRNNPFINSKSLDSGTHSAHSSIGSQQNSLSAAGTTTGSSLRSESWELRTISTPSQPYSLSVLPQQQQAKTYDITVNENQILNSFRDMNDDHQYDVSFPVSRRNNHPIRTTALSTVPAKDVLTHNTDHTDERPTIVMATGSHRRASSNA